MSFSLRGYMAKKANELIDALDQRQVAQILAVMFDQVEANSNASCPRPLLRSACKSGVPSSRAIIASPSIRNDMALMSAAPHQ